MVRPENRPEKGKDFDGRPTKRDQIEDNLKRVYNETLDEPLPDKLASLLDRLRKSEGN